MTAVALLEAEHAESSARELCRVTYDALLAAKAAEPRNAAELCAMRRDLAHAEIRHERVLAQLWRARTADWLGRCDACA